jgi:hypothetical protein
MRALARNEPLFQPSNEPLWIDMALQRLFLPVLVFAAFAGSVAVRAEEYRKGENPLSVITRWRPVAEPAPMPDFVRRTRPAESELDYVPLTPAKVDRPKVKSKEELAATLRGLDKAAAGVKARGAAVGAGGKADAARVLQAAAESRRRAVEDFKVGGQADTQSRP